MDNNERMWSEDSYGNYWLVFPNKHALDNEEIRTIFSEFGKVIRVSAAGDEKGLRFVQYSTPLEAETAVNGLQNHSKIKLVPYIPKHRSKNLNKPLDDCQSNNAGLEQPIENDNVKRNLYQRKSAKNKKTDSQSHYSYNNNASTFSQTIDTSRLNHNNDNASVYSNNLSQDFLPKETETSPTRSSGRNSSSSSISSVNTGKRLLKLKECIKTNVSSSPYDTIPNLVTKSDSSQNNRPKQVVLNAEEIIVGNIHECINSAFILHLFESFDPLAISYINVVPSTEIRYCHVYFKTQQDSIEVEEQFDNYDLAGKKLVVMRPCKLVEQASCRS